MRPASYRRFESGMMSFPEIAKRLGITTSTASELYRSGMAKLRARPATMRKLRDLAQAYRDLRDAR